MADNRGSSNFQACGWSIDGLETFNQLAREIFINRKEQGEIFDKAFKEHMEQEIASTNKTGKRKRKCVATYNDLNANEMMKNYEECSDTEEEGWVAKNLFIV